MQTKILSCKVITPLFSYGMNKNMPELRPTELKGMIRYIYRVTKQNVLSGTELFNEESERFGSTKKPSPLRLQMKLGDKSKTGYKCLVMHKRNITSKCIEENSTFNVILRTESNADIQWYENIIRLSFYLYGMGKRTRRARGCVCIDEKEKTAEETQNDILYLLNEIADAEKASYVYKNLDIEPVKLTDVKSPAIQRISFGKIVKDNELVNFLKAVDLAGHDTKKDNKQLPKEDATGTSQFASSIIVSLSKVSDGYLPIYSYVKAIYKEKEIDVNLEQRSEFKRKIEDRVR